MKLQQIEKELRKIKKEFDRLLCTASVQCVDPVELQELRECRSRLLALADRLRLEKDLLIIQRTDPR